MRGWGAAAVFFLSFGLYLWTMPPTLAPYRDAGEMSSSSATLGVSHPPSYPVYIVLGRLFSSLGLGTHAYRLNLLSALAGAGALAVLWLVLLRLGPFPAASACLLLATNPTFWGVCLVQEMYTLTLLFAMVMLWMSQELAERFRLRLWLAACLCFGLFLGNRTDLLLWAPGLLALGRPGWRRLPLAAGFGLLGLAIYLYLPFRSSAGPWLDWNHPSTLYNFVGSLTRRGYGGTLDLLSKSYAPGSMFLPNLKVYAGHLWAAFGPLGLALTLLGLWRAWGERRRFWAYSLLYVLSGPVFLYLANMPPNPHALAIVEPHYLLSDVVLALWAAEGVSALPTPAVAALALAIQPWFFGRWAQMDRRWNLLAYDYVHNVMRSAPRGSLVIAKKDVQIFSLWHYHRVENLRPDVRVVGQGIAHSPWYQNSAARWEKSGGIPLNPGPLQELKDFQEFLSRNAEPAFATTDVDLPPGLPLGPPRGLLAGLSTSTALSALPWEFLVRRGDYRYDERPDFFTSDLVDAYALSRQRLGAALLDKGADAEASFHLLAGWAMKRLLPDAPAYLAFLAYRSNDLSAAAARYDEAAALYDGLIALTERYHSLPELKQGVRSSAMDVLVNQGVALEKAGRRDDAEAAYRRAMAVNPRAAKPHYNLAVLYWNRDWRKATDELRAALAIEPGYADALKYLPKAEAALKASGHR